LICLLPVAAGFFVALVSPSAAQEPAPAAAHAPAATHPATATPAAPSPTAAARSHLQHGRHQDAAAAFTLLLTSPSADVRLAAALGLAECHLAVGEFDRTITLLQATARDHPQHASVWGRLAEAQFQMGDWTAARKSAEEGLRCDTDALRSRLILADLHREAGELDAALEGYRWFVRYYNRRQPTDAESLRLSALGALEYARWKRVSSVFHFVVNTVCPDALKADPTDWRTHLLSGELLLEKYNSGEALPEFQAALAINPQAAEVHAALARAALQEREFAKAVAHADRALAIHPRLATALQARAEAAMELDDLETAERCVARAIESNPRDQRSLALRAIVLMLRRGIPTAAEFERLLAKFTPERPSAANRPPANRSPAAPPTPAAPSTSAAPSTPVAPSTPAAPIDPAALPVSGEPAPLGGTDALRELAALADELAARNPRPGEFLNRVGEFLESCRRYAQAELCWRRAVDVMPQLSAPQTNLGLHQMRTGRIEAAEASLQAAFKADPFHVRVSNMRKVLGVLKGYETLRSEHFAVRIAASDKRLGEYMAEHLEAVHAELVPRYGYEPTEPTQFEIYSAAQGQTAHQWFSARMVGLPWIQTIGASTGMIVALASPTATDQPFHWGRVLRHEYVHILTLQRTGFQIPHWFAEALAVREEGVWLPPEWRKLLSRRHAVGDLFTLATIDGGFQRPRGPDDWTLAYCQSRQYAKFLEDRWGAEALPRLLDAYARGLATPAAIRDVTGVELAEFERQHRIWLAELVDLIALSSIDPEIDLETAKREFLAQPESATALGRYAWAVWKRGEIEEARSLATEACRLDRREPLAAHVLARLAEADGDPDAALLLWEAGFHPDQPHPVPLAMLAERAVQAGELAAALDLYRLGVDKFPLEETFWKGLAAAALATGDLQEAERGLRELAQREPENAGVRKKLAELALERRDYEAARLWGWELLFVDVEDPDAHLLLGRAYAGLRQPHRARVELQTALAVEPASIPARLALARLERDQGRAEAAREQLRAILAADPEHHEAAALLQELDAAAPGR